MLQPGSLRQSGRKKELEETGAQHEDARRGFERRWPCGGPGRAAKESSPPPAPKGGGVWVVSGAHSINAGSARGDAKIHGFKAFKKFMLKYCVSIGPLEWQAFFFFPG